MRIPICVDTIFRPQRQYYPLPSVPIVTYLSKFALRSDKTNILVNNKVVDIIRRYKFRFCPNTFSLKNTTKNISSF